MDDGTIETFIWLVTSLPEIIAERDWAKLEEVYEWLAVISDQHGEPFIAAGFRNRARECRALLERVHGN